MNPIGLTRREALGVGAGALAATLWEGPHTLLAQPAKPTSPLGIAIYSFGIRQAAEKRRDAKADFFDPLHFLDHCHGLGASGIQAPLGERDDAYAQTLRQNAERYGMFLEGIVEMPADATRVDRFERQIRTAAQAGAQVVRTAIIPGRRYEYFDSVESFRTYAERGRKSLEIAEPILARHRVRLAIENHKDARIPERLELLRHFSSEWIGACVDVGNSFTLLEDPIEVVTAYAPWAASVHFKDQAVQEYRDGFLFADVPLGQGFLDLPRMIAILRQAKPNLRFTLEMISRDPLKVPCFTEKYWATLGAVPAPDLARTLRAVREHAAASLLQVSGLPPDEQVAKEAANVETSLTYARERLRI